MRKPYLKSIIRCLQMSAVLVGAMAIVSALHSLWAFGYVNVDNVLRAGLLVGAMMIGFGMLKLLAKSFLGTERMILKSDKLMDRSTFIERTTQDREYQRLLGLEYIIIGIGTTVIAAIFELIVFVLT